MAWQQYVIETPAHELEQLEQALLECGALALSLEDAGDAPILEPRPGEAPLWPRMRVRALFAEDANLDAVYERVVRAVPSASPGSHEALAEADWTQAWLAHARAFSFGTRLCVTPAQLAPDDSAAAIVVLEPGLAFGTGSHPSTAACLDWLAHAELANTRVLDYGCGSGVLAIAACKLGARRVCAVDFDPQARVASRSNAQRNGCASRVCVCAPGQLAACAYDVVLANILARPLIDLAPILTLLVRRGGTLMLAGMLAGQADEVSAAYAPHFTVHSDAQRDGWTALVATRHDGA